MERSLLKLLEEKSLEEYKALQGEWKPDFHSNKEKIYICRQPRFVDVPIHTHEEIILFYVCKGNYIHEIDGNQIKVKAHEILVLSPKARHKIIAGKEQDIAVNIRIYPDTFCEMFSGFEKKDSAFEFLSKVLMGNEKTISYLCFHTSENYCVQNLMENIVRGWCSKRGNSWEILQISLKLVFLYLIQTFEQDTLYLQERSGQSSETILFVTEYLERNYTQASLEELSGRMHMSPVTLSRMIKSNTGSTFKELLLNKRFQKAAEMLLETDKTVNDIAEEIGYENNSYFYKRFTERYHMTPKKYREMYKEIRKENEEERMKLEIQGKMDYYWKDRAESYSQQNKGQLEDPHHKVWEKIIMENAPQKEKLKILDMGTGPGFFAVLLSRLGHDVTGADRNAAMLEEAEKNARLYDVHPEFIQVGEQLPFEDESFDIVISRDVTWMLMEPEKTLEQWFSKVRLGGRLMYFDANWYGYLKDREETKKYKEFRKFVRERKGFVYASAVEMEKIAAHLPFTYRDRPKWDLDYWKIYRKKKVYCREMLNPEIYSQMEQLQYAQTPEFLVVVEK